jgi:hypothetical protein
MGFGDKDENIQESRTALSSLRPTAQQFAQGWKQISTDPDQRRQIETELPKLSEDLLDACDNADEIRSRSMHPSLAASSGMPVEVQTALSHILHVTDYAERDDSLLRKSKFLKACTKALESFSEWFTNSGMASSAAASQAVTSQPMGSGRTGTRPSDRI